jgi:uncharacterized protein YqjF (DUF2071 family)
LVPRSLELDTFDGAAWISAVPFRVTEMKLTTPEFLPGSPTFCELNLRTYVRHGDHRGVYFLSIDCSAAIPQLVGRHIFNLPFHHAEISVIRNGDRIDVDLRRERPGLAAVELKAWGAPSGEATTPAGGSLDDFLTNRLSMFVADEKGGLWRGDIAHDPWLLQAAAAGVERNTLLDAVGLNIEEVRPHAAFAPLTRTTAHPLVSTA